MRSFWLGLAAAAVVGAAGCGAASRGIVVADAEYRPPLGTSDIGVVYLTLTSTRPDQIVAVESAEAARIEIHETVIEGGVASMRPAPVVDLPARETIAFRPGGMHLMVFSPDRMGSGERLALTFRLQSGERLEVEVPVWTGPGK